MSKRREIGIEKLSGHLRSQICMISRIPQGYDRFSVSIFAKNLFKAQIYPEYAPTPAQHLVLGEEELVELLESVVRGDDGVADGPLVGEDFVVISSLVGLLISATT